MKQLSEKQKKLSRELHGLDDLYGTIPDHRVRELKRGVKKRIRKTSRREDQEVLKTELLKLEVEEIYE